MNKLYRMVGLAVICLTALRCSKSPTDYKSFLNNQEIVYPGVISDVKVFPGDQRLLLTWNPSPDPSIVKYIVFWNSGKDSLEVNAISHDPSDIVKCYIDHLTEYNYTLFIYAFDARGNKSIPVEVDNVKVYGPLYAAGLYNRSVASNAGAYNNNNYTSVTLNFSKPSDTINIATEINYLDSIGTPRKTWLSPDSSSITLSSYKTGSPILYRSMYIPVAGAIDTFYTASADTFPMINVLCNKSLFAASPLPGDGNTSTFSANGASLDLIWDGDPGNWPNVYYSNEILPYTFTIDLGKIYSRIAKFEEWGRDDFAGDNVTELEIWGIADTSGASTLLSPADSGWIQESIDKGWTLLGHLKRDDDGTEGFKINLNQNVPPVRFIRFRILDRASSSRSYTTMSEISFWYYP